MGATEANGSDEFFKGSGYAQEYLITKKKQTQKRDREAREFPASR
jgi:hypothetical protein